MDDRSRRFVEELLECSVCMNSFKTSGPRTPKMLPCQHTFCFDCLKNMMEYYSIECPACRQTFRKSVEDLPNHFVLLQLIDCGGQNKNKKCEVCKLQSQDTKSYCESCMDEIVERELAKSIALTEKYEKSDKYEIAPSQDYDRSTLRRRHISQTTNSNPEPVINENPARRQNQTSKSFMRSPLFLDILMLFNVLMLIFLFFYHCEIVMISIGRIIIYLKNEVIPLLYNNIIKILIIMSQFMYSSWQWLQYVWTTYSSTFFTALLEFTVFILSCVYTALLYIFKFTFNVLFHATTLIINGIAAVSQALANQ